MDQPHRTVWGWLLLTNIDWQPRVVIVLLLVLWALSLLGW